MVAPHTLGSVFLFAFSSCALLSITRLLIRLDKDEMSFAPPCRTFTSLRTRGARGSRGSGLGWATTGTGVGTDFCFLLGFEFGLVSFELMGGGNASPIGPIRPPWIGWGFGVALDGILFGAVEAIGSDAGVEEGLEVGLEEDAGFRRQGPSALVAAGGCGADCTGEMVSGVSTPRGGGLSSCVMDDSGEVLAGITGGEVSDVSTVAPNPTALDADAGVVAVAGAAVVVVVPNGGNAT
jgi:hypothetical protein